MTTNLNFLSEQLKSTAQTLKQQALASLPESERQRYALAEQMEHEAGKMENAHASLGEVRTGSRITSAGLAKISEASRRAWYDCPIDCGVKHRRAHPHMRKQQGKVTEFRRAKKVA